MYALFLGILLCCCVYSFFVGKRSLALILLIGFLQDPFRKLIPGEPVVFVVMVGVMFVFTWASLVMRVGTKNCLEPFLKWSNVLSKPLFLLLILLVLQFFHSYFRYGSLVVSSIGLVSYITPLLAIMVGYFLIDSIQDIRRFMKLYAVVGIVLAVTVLLSFMGYDWSIFKEVGVGLKIYDQGTVLKSYSGFMRTGEIAAWHLATSACFLVVLFATSQKTNKLFWVAVILLVLLMSIMITGRRKMVMLFSMFGLLYLIGYFYYRKSIKVKYLVPAVLSTFAIWLGIEMVFPGGYNDTFNNYFARGASVYGDASERFLTLGINPVQWAINRVGLLGGGLGIASQGSHLFNNLNMGGAGEGGLGKIMIELGAPGLLITLWFCITLAFYIHRGLHLTANVSIHREILPLMLGITMILIANAMTFSIATQVYGDIFILLLLGLFAGFVLALPKIVMRAIDDTGQ